MALGDAAAPLRLRPHQDEAVADIVAGLGGADRGTCVMACGTGKTLVGQRAAEALLATTTSPRVLVLFPSIALLDQSFRAWRRNASVAFEALAICSDSTVGGDDDRDEPVADLPLPVTTDPAAISTWVCERTETMRVAFCTYQSSPVLADLSLVDRRRWDFVIADEAHRCAGPTDGAFKTVLDDTRIPASKRLFLTATPRITAVGHAGEAPVASMDDESRFGPRLHTLTFRDAIDRGLLSDYRIAVVAVTDTDAQRIVMHDDLVTVAGHTIDTASVAAQIGLIRAAKEHDLRRLLVFHNAISRSERFAATLKELFARIPANQRPEGQLVVEHLDGRDDTATKTLVLNYLRSIGDANADEWMVLTNVRCLSEGVDVPTLDAIMFAEPRSSQIDVAQAVGRAIRLNPLRDDPALIILPVYLGDAENPENAIEDSKFRHIYQTITALADHDDHFAAELRLRRRQHDQGDPSELPDHITLTSSTPGSLNSAFLQAFSLRIIERTTSDWTARLDELREHLSRHGNFPVWNTRLGIWVKAQRTFGKAGKLSADRLAQLESLPEWIWEVNRDRWPEWYDEVRKHLANHDNVYPTAAASNLGAWVVRQRRFGNAGELSDEQIAKLEALPGWVWSVLGDRWNERYAELREHLAGHGGVYPIKAKRSQNWIRDQRRAYKLGGLSAEQIAKLEALPGWVWSGLGDRWNERYDELREHLASHDGAYPAQTTRSQNWMRDQRQAYKAGRLSAEQIAKLEALPRWAWSGVEVHEVQWAERYDELREHLASHSGDYPVGNKLASWAHTQREAYRTQELSAERIMQLEALPAWAWKPLEDRWAERCNELRGHLTTHGEYPGARSELAIWVQNQRTAYKAGKLSIDRSGQLEALPGWAWNPLEDRWALRCNELREHLTTHGKYPAANTALGKWTTRQSDAYRIGSLNADRSGQLEALPGWVERSQPADTRESRRR